MNARAAKSFEMLLEMVANEGVTLVMATHGTANWPSAVIEWW